MKFFKPFIICIAIAIGIVSCSKDNENNNDNNASIKTTPVTVLSYRAAKTGGAIEQSSSAVIQRGVCYGESPSPTITNTITKDGTGLGTFTSNLNQLTANKKYYLRAYMVNETGTYYGNEVEFTTLDYPTENIWTLNESVYVVNSLIGFVWAATDKSFAATDEVATEGNIISIKFKQKPTETRIYKLVNKDPKVSELADDECVIAVISTRKPNDGTFIYTLDTPHTFQLTYSGSKCTLNISNVELSNRDDIAKKVTFKAILKEK